MFNTKRQSLTFIAILCSVLGCKARNRSSAKAVAADPAAKNVALIAYDTSHAPSDIGQFMKMNAQVMDKVFSESLKGQGFTAIKVNGTDTITIEEFRKGLNAAVSNLQADSTLFLHITASAFSPYSGHGGGIAFGNRAYSYQQLFMDIQDFRARNATKNAPSAPFARLWLILDVAHSASVKSAGPQTGSSNTNMPTAQNSSPEEKVDEIIRATGGGANGAAPDQRLDWSKWGFREFVILPGATAEAYTYYGPEGGSFTLSLSRAFEQLAAPSQEGKRPATIGDLISLTYNAMNDGYGIGSYYSSSDGRVLGYVSDAKMWGEFLWPQPATK